MLLLFALPLALASPEVIGDLAREVEISGQAALRSGDPAVHACVKSRLVAIRTLADIAATAERDAEAAREEGEARAVDLMERKVAIATERATHLAREAAACPSEVADEARRGVGWVGLGGAWHIGQSAGGRGSGGYATDSWSLSGTAFVHPDHVWVSTGAEVRAPRVAVGLSTDVDRAKSRWAMTPLASVTYRSPFVDVTVEAGARLVTDDTHVRPAGSVTARGEVGDFTLHGGVALNRGWWIGDSPGAALIAGGSWNPWRGLGIGLDVALPVDLDTDRPTAPVLGLSAQWKWKGP